MIEVIYFYFLLKKKFLNLFEYFVNIFRQDNFYKLINFRYNQH